MYLTQEVLDAWIAGAKSGQGKVLDIEAKLDDHGASYFECDCRPCYVNRVGGSIYTSPEVASADPPPDPLNTVSQPLKLCST